MRMKRKLIEWAANNVDKLAIGDILSGDDVYAILFVKYNSWKSTFDVDSDNPSEKDDVLNMLWSGMVSTSLPALQNAVKNINAMGKLEYQKTVDGTLKKTGDTTRTPNLSEITNNDAYADTITNTSYTETAETINSTVAYNTLAEKEREKSASTTTMPERDTTTNYGANKSTINRTGTETNNVNLTDKNDVSETGFTTSPELIKDSILYVNSRQPVYTFIDRFVHQFFTF